ncbi:cytochrome P450 [Fennellomyces sp. T-0311]|nr:cytochrome P450 [Fennellomyces sp. T-0311]
MDTLVDFAEKHKVSISTSIVLLGLYLGYREMIKPPRHLRHIPHVEFWKFIGNFLAKRPFDEVVNEVIMPVAKNSESGLYIRFDKDGWSVHITRPEAAKKFLLKTNIFEKTNIMIERENTLINRFSNGRRNILVLTGRAWKHQRMIANPAFHRSMPIDLFGNLTVKLFKTMDAMAGPIEFHRMMERWTLEAIGKAGFDFDFRAIEDKDSKWVQLYRGIITAVLSPLFLFFPVLDSPSLRFLFPERAERHEQLTTFLDMLQGIITQKREILKKNEKADIKDNEKDLLTLLLEAGNDGGDSLTDNELLSNLCIFFLAGHDTTANALSFAAYYLAVHPEIQEKAREEAIRILGDEPNDILPKHEQLQKMPYINMVIKEVLRMDPPAANVITREATEDTDLSGVFIPKGTKIMLDIYAIHHNPTVWKDPETFNPERFAPEGENSRGGLSWVPFSNGARQCIGMNFSLAEQRVLLPMLLRKYEWSLPDDTIHKEKLRLSNQSILKPQSLYINFKKRY